MLQRAASNAYSWWWASHIRTKQSKWMEQNLQDMGEKVQNVIKLIEEDGDSFAKRAEMYYKKRPELIYFVEEFYRAYRALAERYDHISKELQNANNTIASVFPEQVQFAMEEEEYNATSKLPKRSPEVSKDVPKVPKIPKDIKSIPTSATKKLQSKKSMKTTKSATVAKSGLSKSKGIQEIDRLQKEILTLQTAKEFVKSSYEGGLAKYWEIDEKIKEMQDKVYSLQDEFGTGIVIEDEDARQLMASAALKSCQETLAQLDDKQKKSVEEAEVESKRIGDAREKLKSLKDEFLHGEINQEKPKAKDKSMKVVSEMKNLDQEPSIVTQERKDLEQLSVKIKEQSEMESNASLCVIELAEKIDVLVNKVISLDAAVSTQMALIQRLRAETDELQTQIGILEDDKATLINGKNDLRAKLVEMEEKLLGLQELNRNFENQNNVLQTHFTEAHCNLDQISEKLHDWKPDEELQATPQAEWKSLVEVESQQEVKKQEGQVHGNEDLHELQTINSEEKSEILGEQHLDLNRIVEDQNNILQTNFAEAQDNLVHISEKLHDWKPDEELQATSQSEWKSQVEVESQEEVQRQEGQLHGKDGLHEQQKIKSEEERKILDKQQDDIKRQEGELNNKKDLHEPQKLEKEEGHRVSGKPRKELRRQQVALYLNESKHMELKDELKVPDSLQKEMNLPAEVNAKAELKEREEKVKTEELKVSESSWNEKEFSAEVNSQAQLEGKGQESKFNPEDLNVSGTTHKESRGRGSALGPDSIIDESRNVIYVKPDGEIEVSVSSQKDKATDEKMEEEEIKEHDLSISNRNRGEGASPPQTSDEPDDPLEKFHNINMNEKVDKPDSAKAVENLLFEIQQATEQDDEPDWKHLFMNGIGNREKVLLSEYAAILRNYKEVKQKLSETENKNGDDLFDIMLQLKELRSANAKKDEQIKILSQKLSLLQAGLAEASESEKLNPMESQKLDTDVIDDFQLIMMDEPEISPIEEKFRTSIDELLEENLDFWLRFSSTLYQIQKFETETKDLQSELLKLEEKKKQQDGSTNAKFSLKSDAKPLYKHLREIHTELTVWLEQSMSLKDELKSRFSSLCDIQEEITAALKESAEDDDFKFTSYQAAKFRGEILNMKQENNKVADELQAGLDHVTTLQLEVENTLAKLNEEFKLGGSKNHQNIQLERSDSRAGVPLRSFIFGNKPKKQKHSIFSCVHPVLQKKYNGFKAGMNV